MIDLGCKITDLVYRLGLCLDEARLDERIHAADDGILHTITNLLVDVAGNAATARANLVVSIATHLETDPPGQPPMARSIQGQVYHVDFVRRDSRWRISGIETSPVWKSGHLDRSPTPR